VIKIGFNDFENKQLITYKFVVFSTYNNELPSASPKEGNLK